MKKTVALMFGGKSVEHEVSIISGIQAFMNMDTEKYNVIPVYITKENEMYIGEKIGQMEAYKDIPSLLASSRRVVLVNKDGKVFLTQFPQKKFGKNEEIGIDIAFPVVHGTNVEDGALQGYLKTLGLPFVGCDVAASAYGMDKYGSKILWKENGIPVLDCACYTAKDYADPETLLNDIEAKIGYPVIIKPVNLGSSVGIKIAKDRGTLAEAVDDAFLYSRRILAEHAVTNLREINCSVLGDENVAEASEIEEPMHSDEILSYEDKYMHGGKGAKGSKTGGAKSGETGGMAGVSRQIPADIPDEQRKLVRELAVKAFQVLGCCGVARIDFILDGDTDRIYINEINTIPGSLSFYLWEPVGVPYKELLTRMIELAEKRMREEKALTFSFDTNLLNTQSLSGVKK